MRASRAQAMRRSLTGWGTTGSARLRRSAPHCRRPDGLDRGVRSGGPDDVPGSAQNPSSTPPALWSRSDRSASSELGEAEAMPFPPGRYEWPAERDLTYTESDDRCTRCDYSGMCRLLAGDTGGFTG